MATTAAELAQGVQLALSGTSITFGSEHGFASGDTVVYGKGAGGNTAVGGLTDGDEYIVIALDEFNIRLATDVNDLLGSVVTLTGSGGTGSGHTLTRNASTPALVATFTPSSAVNATATVSGVTAGSTMDDKISFTHGSQNLQLSTNNERLDALVEDLNLSLALALAAGSAVVPVTASHDGSKLTLTSANSATLSVLSPGRALDNDVLEGSLLGFADTATPSTTLTAAEYTRG